MTGKMDVLPLNVSPSALRLGIMLTLLSQGPQLIALPVEKNEVGRLVCVCFASWMSTRDQSTELSNFDPREIVSGSREDLCSSFP